MFTELNRGRSALIGSTGFVGSNIARLLNFDCLYNSSNIATIRGKSFDTIVCAGASAKKWWANKNPEADRSNVQALVDCLRDVRCERFVLISTIDVYARPVNVTELDEPSEHGLHAYGKNRLHLERQVVQMFDAVHIIRLPGLFGPGLKKNIIYDLINRNEVWKIAPNSSYQWYSVGRLVNDINAAMAAELPIVNFATPPIRTEVLMRKLFPEITVGTVSVTEAHYDMHTIYSEVFSGSGRYICEQSVILEQLADFLCGFAKRTS